MCSHSFVQFAEIDVPGFAVYLEVIASKKPISLSENKRLTYSGSIVLKRVENASQAKECWTFLFTVSISMFS